MPKAGRTRSHVSAAPLRKQPSPAATAAASPVATEAPAAVLPAAIAAAVSIDAETVSKPERLSKKGRMQERRQRFLEKLSTHKYQQARDAIKDKPLLSLGMDMRDELSKSKLAAAREMAEAAAALAAPEVPAKAAPKPGAPVQVKSRRARHNKMKDEAVRFKAVLNHDAYQNDPFGTIQLHLQNTLGASNPSS
ncbi:hypothetical protein H9P43_001258 [Blastocladiella emersonii ATCC 22665]|nr:hypothetical protein H9P43_001258 [Blastocladiella emersonii ATCC 22665]